MSAVAAFEPVSACPYELHGQLLSPAFSEPPSPMSTTSDHDDAHMKTEEEDDGATAAAVKQFVNKKPKFPTKYHEMLLPLSPITTVGHRGFGSAAARTNANVVDADLQSRLRDLTVLGSTSDLAAFLSANAENVDVNAMDPTDGRSAVHHACLAGRRCAAALLAAHGADLRLADRDGFSPAHLASFSGNAELVDFILSSASSPKS